ncbi:EAL domain-containing protein [Aquabacter sp. L1I39]|uniref:bifunctional diguanylate cyclase/phosphodiesterase n=1 Tax=Aquabacter sp. L1I39 TaxID=2820278 RepID=UPI001ADA49E9|nr:EAL domain-containing protein [Aquabacter sp. L1I39]QTL04607.1 EAL domain-containing protein [Aquabacter sp. L1I39]
MDVPPDHSSPLLNVTRPPAPGRAKGVVWVAALGALFAVAALATAAIMVLSLERHAVADRQREMANLALTLSEQTARAFEALELVQLSVVDFIAAAGVTDRDGLQRAVSTMAMHQTLREKIDALPYVDAVTIIDENGKLLNFSRYWPIPPVNISDRDYFIALKSMTGPDTFISVPVPNRGTGTMTIYLARRFTTPDGKFLGLVLGAMEQAYFENFFGAINLGRDGAILLARDDGAYLASHPHLVPPAGLAEQRQERARDILAQRGPQIAPPGLVDDKERLVAVNSPERYPMAVMVTDTLSAVQRSVRPQAWAILTGAVLLCLVIGGLVVVAIRFLRSQHNFAATAHYTARHDPLTSLPNRLLLGERIAQALGQGEASFPLAVLFLDLDYFKSINDTLGHAVGDALLQAVARRIEGCVGADATVSRLGGDEFAILHPRTDADAALALAERLLAAIRAPFVVERHRVIAGGSIGVAVAPEHGETTTDLLKNADLALYRAKGDGRGQARVFHREMERNALTRRTLELDLDAAWREGLFCLQYQPIFAIHDQRLVAFEALLRWRHPSRGLVSPGSFIAVLEETGLVIPVGAWVLEQACRAAMQWPEQMRVAVNLSPIQFRGNLASQQVTNALRQSGLQPHRLEVEITETALLDESDAAEAAFESFRAQGISVALDDFGTGYSSMSYLRRLTFSRIKIDQTFIEGLEQGGQGHAIVRAMIGLAQALKVEITAEGVERQEQLEILRTEGCTHVQGFLLGRPMGEEEAATLAMRMAR